MAFPTITGAGTTTATKFFGDAMNRLSNMLNGVDTSADAVVEIHNNVTWTFNQANLLFFNPARTFKYTIQAGAITAARTLNLPVITGTDTIAVTTLAQTIKNKSLDTTNTFVDSTDTTKVVALSLTGITTGTTRTLTIPDVSSTVAVLGFTQTWTAAQSYTTGLLKVADVADSNGNKSLALTATASAVDYLTLVNAATANPATVQLSATGSDSNINIKIIPKGTGVAFGNQETLIIPLGDETTTLTSTGTKITIYAPFAFNLASVYQSANTAPTTAALTLDILNNAGSSIFSTKPTIAAAANTGSNGVLTSTPTTFAQGDKIQFQVNTLDTGGTSAGVKLYLVIYRTA